MKNEKRLGEALLRFDGPIEEVIKSILDMQDAAFKTRTEWDIESAIDLVLSRGNQLPDPRP